MTTYDYECDACGHKFEHFQGINSDVLTKCPQCEELKLRRLFGTGGGLLFKGSGFYKTDYRSDSYTKAAKADSSSSDSTSGSSSTKSDGGGKSDGGNKSSGSGKTDSGGTKSGGGDSK